MGYRQLQPTGSRRWIAIACLAIGMAVSAAAFVAVFLRQLTLLTDKTDAAVLAVVWTSFFATSLFLIRALRFGTGAAACGLVAVTAVVAFLAVAGKQFPDLFRATAKYRTEVDRIVTADGVFVARLHMSRYALGSGNLTVTRDTRLCGRLHRREVVAVGPSRLADEKFRLRAAGGGREALTFGDLLVAEFDAR